MNRTLVMWCRTGPHLTRFCLHHRVGSSVHPYSTSASTSGQDVQDPILLPFTQCGVRPALARAMAAAFNITSPTPLQANLLSLMARSPTRDLIVRNATGSGKSFALAVGLLNSPRPPSPLAERTGGIQPAHLLLVPHPDLAHQLTRWMHALVPKDLHAHVVAHALPGMPDPSAADKPHVLIGTPTRMLDLLANGVLDPRAIGTLALDEVDQLTPPIPRWDVQRASVRRRHPRPVEVLVAQLAAKRSGSPEVADMPGDELVRMLTSGKEKEGRLPDGQFKAWLKAKPRMVCVSATASSVVRTHLVSRLKWMHPRRWAFVDGEQHVVGPRVRHCALVVGAGKESVASLVLVDRHETEQSSLVKAEEDKDAHQASVTDLVSSLVAYARATDVKHALVVVLGDVGVNRTVDEFNKLFNIRASVWSPSSSSSQQSTAAVDPWIQFQVVSYGGIRGLDIPDLTHVFLLGAPADVSEYQHIAGRVGRLGGSNAKDAMVVTFCDVKSGERLRQIWQWMGDKRVKVELVDAEVVDKVKFGGTV
ncbi:P-loop containing nucleoside triphosphate hydrolase protein [Catenaria anguillulae PL171]|uniref:RNA helicase n=1 Tax=Catenaria anguillulae PL171 TaxID=765915 RepID=A0A1Y2HUU7_9FUNG|nr:P-loop containing nucleoside triphosphate hydrolase protein [Catenaria anguillulae PL171]